MWKRLRGVPPVVVAALSLASCNSSANKAAAPPAEADQAVSAAMKDLYMAASAAAPQSDAQQKVILRMAQKASNGKELLLAMRAAAGVFPAGGQSQIESQVRGAGASKMMQFGTLNQMIEYATEYPVNQADARPYVERMFQLAEGESDPRIWYRIRVAAFHLRVDDLERQAQAKGDELARK
jgi:hypothetical protein